jgi:hypothetical protein
MWADLKVVIISGPENYLDTVKIYEDDLKWVTKAQNIEYLDKDWISCICEM